MSCDKPIKFEKIKRSLKQQIVDKDERGGYL